MLNEKIKNSPLYAKLILLPVLILILVLLLIPITKSANQTTSGLQKNKTITKVQAENIVRNLPEVKKRISDKGTEWIVESINKNDVWTVHVARIVKDNDSLSHMATFNWYDLDKITGKITCSMFVYDKNGNSTGKVESCK